MKTTPFAMTLFCAAALASASVHAQSQANPRQLSDPTLKFAPSAVRIDSVTIPDSASLRDAVNLVQNMKPESQEPLNILLDPEVQDRRVPALTLRNVTGLDALSLIAAAANVDLKHVKGLEGGVVGYKLSAPPPNPWEQSWLRGLGARYGRHDNSTARSSGNGQGLESQEPKEAVPGVRSDSGLSARKGGGEGDPFGAEFGEAETSGGYSPQSRGSYGGESRSSGGTGVESYGGNRYGIGSGGYGGGSFGNLLAGQSHEPERTTEIYPLASIASVYDFSEIETAIQDLIKAGEIPAKSVKLSFHEKTNVLIVNGDENLHRLVQGLFQALRENAAEEQAVLQQRGQERLQNELQSLLQLKDRMKKELEEERARTAKLESVLQQLENRQKQVRE